MFTISLLSDKLLNEIGIRLIIPCFHCESCECIIPKNIVTMYMTYLDRYRKKSSEEPNFRCVNNYVILFFSHRMLPVSCFV